MVFKEVGAGVYENNTRLGRGFEISITVDKVRPGSIKLYAKGALITHCSTEDKSIVALNKAAKTMINGLVLDLQSVIKTIPTSTYRSNISQMVLFE